MNRRQSLLAVSVALLASANLWYWWPSSSPAPKAASRVGGAGGLRVEEFQLKIATAGREVSGEGRRNLFQPKIAVMAKPAKAPDALPTPPPKTPEELAREAAQAELALIKLVGVVFRYGQGQAFLVKGDQLYMVAAGEKVGERFTVETISADAVRLKDPQTNVEGQVLISGR